MILDYSELFTQRFDLWVCVDTHADVPYAIRDSANHEQVIVRSHSLENLLAWAEAFLAQTPGATLDTATVELALAFAGSPGHSVKVDAPRLRLVVG